MLHCGQSAEACIHTVDLVILHMQLSIAVGALMFYPLDATLRIARAAGVDAVEIMLSNRLQADGGSSIAERARRAGVTVASAHAALSFRGETLEEKTASDMVSIRTAAAIEGCSVLVLHTPLDWNGRTSTVQHWLDAVVEFRERLDPTLTLAVENRAQNWDGMPDQWLDDLHRLSSVAGEWGARVCLDLAHAASFGFDLATSIDATSPALANVHLSDACDRQLRGGALNGLYRDHLLPGNGHLALDDAISQLSSSGYRGPLTLEFSPRSLAIWLPGVPQRRLRRAVSDVRALVTAAEAASVPPITGRRQRI